MKRFLTGIRLLAAAAFSLVCLTACGPKSPQDTIQKALDLDVSGGSEVSCYDTHSGNGDGTSCIVFHFSNGALLDQIKNDARWIPLPLDQTTEILVYGLSSETCSIGPYLTDGDGNTLIPDVENGYYLLIDRQAKDDDIDGTGLLERGSFNFTLGLYDTDTNTLYFCELDT